MILDPNNRIVQYCANGMQLETEGKNSEAKALYQIAWDQAVNNFEKFTAAHYLARQQETIPEKLKWDLKSLELAFAVDDQNLQGAYPSLCLNIGKCYEDLQDYQKAKEYYRLGQSYTRHLLDDGYGNMIKAGIKNGLERISKHLR